MLRVELPSSARRSEAQTPDTPQENGSIVDIIISLLCGIVCNNEQYNKTVGKIRQYHRQLPRVTFIDRYRRIY